MTAGEIVNAAGDSEEDRRGRSGRSGRPRASTAAGGPGAGILPVIAAIGTKVPADSYTQRDILDEFDISDPRVRSVFLNSGIERRYLGLSRRESDGARQVESQGELLRRHAAQGVSLGRGAIEACLQEVGASPSDVRYLCCVTSTGFLTPGLSARLIKEMGIPPDCARLDVVGMGCNAGLNGLTAVTGWSARHPGELGVLACIEVCSAAYVVDSSMRASVVNSLFGDGAAAVSVLTAPARSPRQPALLGFASRLIPEAIDAMRFDWDDTHGKFSFFLDPEVPYILGAQAKQAVSGLLSGTGLRQSDIGHWVIHAGGKKVIDSVRINLGLARHDVRHTIRVLRDYGNLSSASFLFSLERLMHEATVAAGDYGVVMTMGPGSTIEAALIRW